MARIHVSVITGENDQCLIIQPISLERTENAPNMPIDLIGQSAIDPTIDLPLPLIVDLPHRSRRGHGACLGIEIDRIGFKLRNPKVVR